MMSPAESHSPADADWRQIEAFVDQLHEQARAPTETKAFYQGLLAGCVSLLAAEGGAIWFPVGRGRWRTVCQINSDRVQHELGIDEAEQFKLLNATARDAKPQILPPRVRSADGEPSAATVLGMVAVLEAETIGEAPNTHAVIELYLRSGCSPDVQLGWQEFLTTIAEIAAEFHVHEQLRSLRSERSFYDRSLELMRRFQRSTDLEQTAVEIVNEGRRFAEADRLSLVVRRGNKWQLQATSGVDRIETRADVAKRLQLLAESTANWGEPVDYADAAADDAAELPPELTELIQRHVDQSHARRMVVAPIGLAELDETQAAAGRAAAVLVAEQFTGNASELSQQRVLELAGFCQPALRQAIELDRFPLRSCLRWADRWSQVKENWGLTKLTTAAVAALAVVLALVLVRVDFEVEAPATLRPAIERDVFATTDGKVIDVRIKHGEQVAAGDVLAVLQDPQLALEAERVTGEIATIQKRLESIAVARTDRKVREDTSNEKLPLSAEAEQLSIQLGSLRTQQEILARRQEALMLRSPIDGIVLTLDVQNLLRTLPVSRGQALFTVADMSSGWKLLVDMPQDRIGHVVAAQQQAEERLPIRFRLAGDTAQTYSGHVESISTAAVLDTADLDHESPTIELKVHVDETDLEHARPGMNAQVRVYCGRRSLGYVWLHDIWDTVYSWLVF